MDFWKTRDRSLIVTKGNLITDGEIRYLKKIMAAHIGKLEDTTLFDDDLQKKNVEFFKQLGWKPIGEVISHLGSPHQVMEADLENGKGRE